MTRSSHSPLAPFIPEIEKFTRLNRTGAEARRNPQSDPDSSEHSGDSKEDRHPDPVAPSNPIHLGMTDQAVRAALLTEAEENVRRRLQEKGEAQRDRVRRAPMRYFDQHVETIAYSCISLCPCNNDWAMKSDTIIHLPKFYGNPKEDPLEFLRNYHNHIEIIKPASVDLERAKLKAIRESMAGYAKRWFAGRPANSITTWDEMSRLFLKKLWSADKATQMEYQIISMKQESRESFREYYLRWKEHQPIWLVLKITDKQFLRRFYAGLKPQGKQMFDNAA